MYLEKINNYEKYKCTYNDTCVDVFYSKHAYTSYITAASLQPGIV